MDHVGKLYIELALICVLIATGFGVWQVESSFGMDIVVRYPDITLYDMLYYETTYLFALFGIGALMFLTMALRTPSQLSIITHMMQVLIAIGVLICVRSIFNIITYIQITLLERAIDVSILTLLFTYKCISKCFFLIYRLLYHRTKTG